MNVIGKANKYFTLWTRTDVGVRSIYSYVKNISMSFEKAREEYPDAEYLEWLRGTSTYEINNERLLRFLEPGKMYFGKHLGHYVEEIPVNYLIWLLEQYSPGSPEEFAWWKTTIGRIVRLVENAGCIISGDEHSDHMRVINKNDIREESGLAESFLSGGPVTLKLDYNPGPDGSVTVENVSVKFPEVKEMYYNGYQYWLPAIKNRGRKVKGKEIEITEYAVTEVIDDWSPAPDGIYRRFLNVDIIKWNVKK